MTQYFDGKEYAAKKSEILELKVKCLKENGILPKLKSIIIGEDEGSVLYQNLKKKAAENIGAVLEIIKLAEDFDKEYVIDLIGDFNNDPLVHGIMVQLPLPKKFSGKDCELLINAINKDKDVDGLREDGDYVTPVVQAVVDAIPEGRKSLQVAVLGANGFEGKRIVKRLKYIGYKKIIELGRSEKDINKVLLGSDILVSATGQPDLVQADMVKENAILIDVGSPRGDVSKECYSKASYVSPVPGGIGPATIANLIENLVISAGKNMKYGRDC